MKRLLFIFLSILLVFGCATIDTKQKATTDLEKLAEGATAAAKARIYHTLTGGGSGAMDSTPVANFTDGDINFVITSDGYFHVYHFVAASTTAEESPYYIRPDDYSTAGVHHLINSIYLNKTATPTVTFRDSDATDFDANATITVNCTETGSGTEDCDMVISVQENGTLTAKITIDADQSITFHDYLQIWDTNVWLMNAGIEIDATEDRMDDDQDTGILITNRTCGENLLQWDLVAIKNDTDIWHKADANVAGEFPAIGISAAGCTDGGTVGILTHGVVRNDGWTLTAGQKIYLSTNAGEITTTAPSVSGNCVQIVGWALDGDHIYFDFSRPYQEVP